MRKVKMILQKLSLLGPKCLKELSYRKCRSTIMTNSTIKSAWNKMNKLRQSSKKQKSARIAKSKS
jgi:hypothetical protein